ncbi:max dimerization protein 4-like isoform X2 [Meleagris gallopavo]|uniref:max dimerization protein 4-like isoform X2 n=1 Tax=Meleagris gallopavo TaxID=9103 RepID=UPI00093B819F|nr:max dimerization protein 4-like isoform X2 [Meleagris gallopavo]
MELNSLLILLEAAEYLERRDREAEHGYASVLPFDSDYSRKKTKAGSMARKSPNNRYGSETVPKWARPDAGARPTRAAVTPRGPWWPSPASSCRRLLCCFFFPAALPVLRWH